MTTSFTPLPSAANVCSEDGLFEAEIRYATMTRVGVLITGPEKLAAAVWTEVLRRGRAATCPPDVIDGQDEDALHRALGDGREGRPVIVRNVDRLSLKSQARLLAWTACGHRVISWSECPPDQNLVPELLYRLNVIRIDV